MKKRFLLIISLFSVFLILTSCSRGNKIEKTFNQYKEFWIKKDYQSMYSMLSEDSKKHISKESFIERYSNIYSAMEAKNISIIIDKDKSDKDLTIPFTLSMNSIAGKLNIKGYNITLIKENKDYKIKWNESLIFPKMNNKDIIEVEKYNAKRGNILDKNGAPLATTGIVKSVGIYPAKFKSDDEKDKINKIASILDISESYIENKLNANKNPEHFVPIVDLLDSDRYKINKLLQIKGILINDKKSRVYNGGESIGSLIGYIGSITKEELEKNKNNGYNSSSLIGKAGLESLYEKKLKGKDGGYIYIQRGNEKINIAKKKAINGQDIKLSIDLNLQKKIYSEMNREKGASTAVNPKTGEVLAMVSSPSYDPNIFVTYTSNTQKDAFKKSNNLEFSNRFNDVYSPGSTVKLITAAVGLNNGVINPNLAMDIKGKSWKKDSSWGNYNVTRVKDPGRAITLKDAIKYSDNIYFAKVALDLGSDKFIKGINNFGIGEDLDFEYPIDKTQVSNKGKIDEEILLADTGYGQGQILVSPLHMALAYSALGNDGNIMKPRLNISENSTAKVWKKAIDPNNVDTLVNGFSSVINDSDGTASDIKISGINIAGKTGTAEIKKTQDDNTGTENGWFVGVNTDNSKISLSMIIENVKDRGGSHFVTPKVKNIMEYYLKK
ncbi:penicillin-binding transpeptidase domain-containing protein [Clostridium sporogenes]|uniref:Penicillin-binding transpeptidase domain-containing protein n=1 Tax=Clostridium botulinum TaxID=1491 RepID=A0A6M0T1A6_CLOBO|nr:penicillin-binding transpeptidase domain-containing protein [Clostridium sporogenes]NFA61173.1 penicillin-binding transpeptidase domain-containing protein [Clostridium botulinum]NFI75057.1 penicillin-binding transpeptidase domain-containing protein [Clostridium sporogenes]NFL71993.1 penicillin-binding transpeptidase domain-containing protein [Clostridium sporogenes]NFM25263.1 penicillin-binding transpeptidase domain-containing protein [Clostridium sporogenes]NFP63250.1 penicillin-binding tr